MDSYRHYDSDGIAQFETTPIEERLKAVNTYEILQQGAAINPQAPALSLIMSGDKYDEPITITYQQFLGRINQTANMFHDLGIGKDDVISYLLPNLLQTHFVLWGGEAAGIVNPINPLLEPATVADICQAAGTKVLVTLGQTPGSDIWEKVQAIKDDIPSLKTIVRVMGSSDDAAGTVGFDEVIDNYPDDKLLSGREIQPGDIASMYHTGGTTGTPKLAPHTHYNEAVMAYMTSLVMDYEPGEAMLCGLPLFHVNSATITGSVPFSQGCHVVLLSPAGYRDVSLFKNFFKIVEHYKAVMFSSVPTVLGMLLDAPKIDADISSLRFAVCGAAPLSVELFQRFEDYSQMKILEGYGLTEGTCVSSVNPLYGERKVGSVGLRLPYHQMKCIKVDDQGKFLRDCEVDEIGSVAIKGPNLFTGYMEEVHNEGCWPGDDWFNTGDLGRQDAGGYFWLTGRKKELIIRGGHNIEPSMIEDPLYNMDGVQVAAAVGRPDPYAGEVPVAYVELSGGSDLNSEQIMDFLKENVGERAAFPKEVIILDTMPLTPVGKIFKPKLRWDAAKKVFSKELRALGHMAAKVSVEVGEDKVHGMAAQVSIKPGTGASPDEIEEKVKELLALYTVKYQLQIV